MEKFTVTKNFYYMLRMASLCESEDYTSLLMAVTISGDVFNVRPNTLPTSGSWRGQATLKARVRTLNVRLEF